MTLVIGIAGGTGSGKTTIARRVRDAIPDEHVELIEHDAYYRDRHDLDYDSRCALNFDHPSSLETELFVEHVRQLREDSGVDVPIYDYASHRRKRETRRVEPTDVLILEGILVLAETELRELMDIKIFVDTDADIRLIRRIERDIEQRGRTFEQVRDQYYETVRPMHLRFVEPSKRWADLIVPEGGDNAVALDILIARITQSVRPRP